MENQNELAAVKPTEVNPIEFGVEKKQAEELTSGLQTFRIEREQLIKQYEQVIKMEVTEENIKIFGDLRKQVKHNRTKGFENWHKTQKAFFLAGGRFVDAIKNKEIAVNFYMEERLEEAEKFFENQEKERKEAQRLQRYEELSKYTENAGMYPLADISEEAFQELLKGARLSYEQAEAEKAEQARRAREEAEKVNRYNKRIYELKPFEDVYSPDDNLDLKEMSEADYQELLTALKDAKKAILEEQERIKKENEKLKQEAAAAAAKRSKRQTELTPFMSFIRDYEALISSSDEVYQKEIEGLKIALKQHQEAELAKQKEEQAERARQAAERERIEDEAAAARAALQAEREKAEAIEREKQERIRKQKEAEAELRAKSEAEQILAWIDSMKIEIGPFPDGQACKEITARFEGFKAWAKSIVKR
jgi:hypothetical protein